MKHITLFISIIVSTLCFGQVKPSDRVFQTTYGFTYFKISPCALSPVSTKIEFDHPVEAQLYSIFNCDLSKKKLKHESFYNVVVNEEIYTISPNEISFNYSHEEIYKGFKKFDPDETHIFKRNAAKYDDEFFTKFQREREKEAEEERLILEEKERQEREAARILREAEEKRESLKILKFDSLGSNESYRACILDEREYDSLLLHAEELRKLVLSNGGILLDNFKVTGNDYGATNIELGIYNVGTKRIKYVDFRLKALNPVKDQVGKVETLTGVGFIEPNSSGDWEFERVWYSSTISSAKILSVKLRFEDGTSKTITSVDKIMDTYLLKTVDLMIDNREYEMFGALSLHDYGFDWGEYSFNFRSIDGQHKTTDYFFGSDIPELIEDLEMALTVNYDNVKDHGVFQSRKYSDNIYIVNQDNTKEYIFISPEDASELRLSLMNLNNQ